MIVRTHPTSEYFNVFGEIFDFDPEICRLKRDFLSWSFHPSQQLGVSMIFFFFRTYGHCNYVTDHHATIFYDELSSQYELINYSRHGTRVDECLYSLDTACVSAR